jgi:hypothetical protein
MKYLPSMHFLGRIFNDAHPFQRLSTSYDARAIRLSTFDIFSAQGKSSAPHINVSLEMEGSRAISYRKAIENLLRPLWASISMHCLESLQIVHGYDSVDVWQHIFDGLTGSQLKHLEVIGNGSGIARLHAFSTCLLPQAGTSGGRSRVPLPSLRELAIKRWDFGERVGDGPFFERFKTCLEDRKRHQAAVHKLSLVECHNVIVDHVAKLREVVSHVTWDGPSDDSHHSESDNYDWRDDDSDRSY